MTTSELRFTTPTELLAALPHLLGFVPTNDFVAILLGPEDDEKGLAVRAAIRCPITLTQSQAEAFPLSCNLSADRFSAAVLIAICEPRFDEHAYYTLDTLREALVLSGIPVTARFMLDSVTRHGKWLNVDTHRYGAVKPYTDSAATAQGVYDGRVIAASRADLAAEFEATASAAELADAEELTEELVAATATALRRAITERTAPDEQLAARTAAVITAHIGLRDGFLRLGAGHERSAGWVWTRIAAQHRGRIRAELLTMAALAYYCGADTVRAGLALQHAETAAEDDDAALPSLAELLSVALQERLPPNVLSTVIPTREKAPIPGTTF
ncbi:DUF4192 domain-containing protein [Mycobacterium sp. GA-2829]|uniref:DUF4192 domain-containing protein n=1 Tax=Mycobacterium sp. GA-2829 TaxID=1772283 RepID=UPI00073FF038|nr:DUF4192 domain-containing protein [Mycobacterium sp. GA-2829]KUI34190.1 hypothetical protein AU194_17725 [Mycobacterium sp. GA-2829]